MKWKSRDFSVFLSRCRGPSEFHFGKGNAIIRPRAREFDPDQAFRHRGWIDAPEEAWGRDRVILVIYRPQSCTISLALNP